MYIPQRSDHALTPSQLLEKAVVASAPPLAPTQPSVAGVSEISRLRAKLDRGIEELYRESVQAQEAGLRAQQDYEQREDALRQRLHEARLHRENEQRRLQEMEGKVASLTGEIEKARKGEMRYRTKVRCLSLDMDPVY